MARPRLAVIISGKGRTLQNLHKAISAGRLEAEIVVVVSTDPRAEGLVKCREYGLVCLVIDPHRYPLDSKKQPVEFSRVVWDSIEPFHVDLVCLAGCLHKILIPNKYKDRVLNIHPALLPSPYGGAGMFGDRVHRAVLEAEEKITGCSVHYCTNVYDDGEVIHKLTCEVLPDDDVHSLAARVFELECQAYPEAIRKAWEKIKSG